MPDRWMTYEEAGALFGLSAEAMRKRARRLRWLVQPPNDTQGKARIKVPEDAELRPAAPPPGRPAGDRRDGRPDDLAAELRRRAEAGEQAAKLAEGERDTLAQEVIVQRERTARAEGETAAYREAFSQVLGRAERAEAEQKAAQQELAAWTSGGPLARAWRGFWRGRA